MTTGITECERVATAPPGRQDRTGGQTCRHCLRPCTIDRRDLCRACFRTPEVRDLYPAIDPHRLGVPDFRGPGKVPTPTDAPPGSAEKGAVMAARAESGERLFHPRDNRGGHS
jgi:hypothetical protein